MATTYTSTIEVRCTKEHVCVGCGAAYAYQLYRKITGSGGSAAKASVNAQKNVDRALATAVDVEPCPTCGLVQPDMIGQTRAKRHTVVAWLAFIAFLVIVILRVSYAVTTETAVWLAVGGCAVAALAMFVTETSDPNRNTDANRERALARVAEGKVRHQPGEPQSAQVMTRPSEFSRSLFNRVTLLILGAAVVMAAAPEVIRIVRGWPLNADAYPGVVGPGDHPRVYMQDKIDSVKGYWRAKAQVLVHEAGQPAAKPFAVGGETNQNDWGSTISAKSSEKHNKCTPWVAIAMPEDKIIAGKTMDCDVALAVEYPSMTGSSSFQVQQARMARAVSLKLASTPHAGASYSEWWWQGSVGGMALIVACAIIFNRSARALQKRALPTKVSAAAVPTA